MRRCVLAIALALLLPWAVAAMPAGAAKRSKCQQLKGADLAPAPSVKLVRRANSEDGTDLVGCALPGGRVRKIASSADYYTTTYAYAIRQVAGVFVLTSSSYNSQYAFSESVGVTDIRNGRSYSVASQCFEITGSPCSGEPTAAPFVFVTKLGRAVAAIVASPAGPMGPSTATIAAFDSAGKRRDLDGGPLAEIPVASLALNGVVASWTHAGQPRGADIRTPG
jgi:hypothetical protein